MRKRLSANKSVDMFIWNNRVGDIEDPPDPDIEGFRCKNRYTPLN